VRGKIQGKGMVQMRTEANALVVAFKGAATQLSVAEERNAEALAVLDLCKRLDRGGGIAAEVAHLEKSSKDGVVQAAVHSLPADAGTKGVITADELAQRWGKVRRAVRVNMAVAEDQHRGVLSMSLAAISSALKVRFRASRHAVV